MGVALLVRPEITTHLLLTGLLAGGSYYRPQCAWNPGRGSHESLLRLHSGRVPDLAGAAAHEAECRDKGKLRPNGLHGLT